MAEKEDAVLRRAVEIRAVRPPAHRAFGGTDQPGEHGKKTRLAGAIGPEKLQALSRRQRETHPAHDRRPGAVAPGVFGGKTDGAAVGIH